MDNIFTAAFFAANRQRLQQLFTGTAPIVITAHGRMQQAADEGYAFHQDRSFWYLTGIDDPEVVLVMDKGKEYLILPSQSETQRTFDGGQDMSAMVARSGIATIYESKEGWKQLGGRLKRSQHVATLAPSPEYLDVFGLFTNPARAVLVRRMKECNGTIELLDLRQHIARMRMVKQPVELVALQNAIDITLASIKDATNRRLMQRYKYEYEIEAELIRGFRRRGASGHAFTPIVAGGSRACTLHYIENNAQLEPKELVVLDVGACWQGYAADISRTIAPQGYTRRQEKVHMAVQEAVDHALTILKPGVLLREYEEQMEQYVGEKLRELGLIRSITHDDVRAFFPHATSHFLGLDTHDMGDYDRPLEPGVVVTVEPGIYVPAEGIGVRIEEDVLITESSCRVLSARLPRSLA